jgi:hypothetical protein
MAVRNTQFFVELLLIGPAPDEFTHISTGIIGLSGIAPSASPLDSFFCIFEGGFYLNGEVEGGTNSDLFLGGSILLLGGYDLEIFSSAYEFESSGSLSISNFIESDFSFVSYGTGKIALASGIILKSNVKLFSSGLISISNVLASLTISSPPFAFNWRIRRRDIRIASFAWATTTGRVNYFYRVTGKVRRPIYRPITIPNYGSSASVVLLHASSVGEVCRKLRARNFIHPIYKIEQYTNNLNPDVAYTELTDVTPTYRLLPCAEFFIDFDLVVSMVAASYAIISLLPPETTGGLNINGIGNCNIGVSYISQGFNSISGEVDFSIGF